MSRAVANALVQMSGVVRFCSMGTATDVEPVGELRSLREADVDDVLVIYEQAWGEARPIDRDELLSWLRNPEIQPDALRVLEVGGRIVGYGDVSVEGDAVALEVAAVEHWDVFLEWAERIAHDESADRVRVLSYGGDALSSVAASRGYQLWRSNDTMRIDFAAEPGDVTIAPSIALRTYAVGDEPVLRSAMNEAFAADPFFHGATAAHFREYYLHARGFDPSLWLLAWDGGELAGFVLAYPERIGETIGYIHSLGVRPAWRGQGLGEALIRAAFRTLYQRGLRACVLGVDASNETGALRLYERVGMRSVRKSQNWALDAHRPPH
jgi:mycothiol synthase